MNKSMLTGVIAGVGIATAGGVAGYALLGTGGSTETQSAMIIEEGIDSSASETGTAEIEAPTPVETALAPAPAPATARAASASPRPAPAPATAPARTASAQPAPVVEECWDEEVTVQVDPRDEHAIAGTAAGAVIGGAIAKEVGDDNDLATAAGAAAGAFFGRRAQRRMQENKTTTTIERRCAPVGSR